MRHYVRCGPSCLQKKGTPTPTQFLAHVYCGQMAGWMKTPLIGTEVDLGPGHIVLDGVPASAKGAQQPPLFGPCLLWPRSPISATAELLLPKLLNIQRICALTCGFWKTIWCTRLMMLRFMCYCYRLNMGRC